MRKSSTRTIRNILITLAFPVGMWLIMEVLCLILAKHHVISTSLDIKNLIRNVGITICSALALAYTLGNGRFDLSVGAQRMAAAVIGANFAISMGWGTLGVIICALVCGLVLGSLVGILFVTTRIPAMVLGIGMALIYESLAFVLSKSEGLQIYGVDSVKSLSSAGVCIAIVLAAVFFVFILNHYTKFGFHNRSIRGSQKIAHDSGINIYTHTVICYAIAGTVVAMGGILDAAFKGSMEASIGFSTSATVMTCCFPMFLGKFISKWSVDDALGIIVASITVRIFETGLSVMKVSITAQEVYVAALFLVFLIVRANQYFFVQRKAKKARIAEAQAKRLTMAQTA